jgi:hypothetical protein
MGIKKDFSVPEANQLFFPFDGRPCPSCKGSLRYNYKSSGRKFFRLDGPYYVDSQIVYCSNGRCPLRFKPQHPPEELALAPPLKGYGFDVLAAAGQLRYGEGLTRLQIQARLLEEHPALKISERQVQNLYELYGALTSGGTLTDQSVIRRIRANGALVLSFDGAKPLRDHESVWFVRDDLSGQTLVAQVMRSANKAAVGRMLASVKEFAARIKVPVVGIISDAEGVNRSAVREIFPGVPHQYCQLHYVSNLAKPVAKEDQKLRADMRESMGDLTEIQKDFSEQSTAGGQLTSTQAEVLHDVCESIRSVLSAPGKLPFRPPGIRLFASLKELQQLVRAMRREKGGPICGLLMNFSVTSTDSSSESGRSAHSTKTSGRSARSSSGTRVHHRASARSCVG